MIAVDPQTYWETVARFTDSLPDVDAVGDSGDASTNSGRVRRKRNAPKAGSKLAAAAESANNTNRPLPALASLHHQPEPTADLTIPVRDEESAQKDAPARDGASDALAPHRRSQSFTHKQQHTRRELIDAAATSSAVDMSRTPDISPAPHRYRTTSGSEPHHHKHQDMYASPSSYSTNTSPTNRSEESTGCTNTQNSSPKKEPIRSPLVSVLETGAGSIGANSAGARSARRARIADPSKLNAPVMPSSINLMPLLRKQHTNHQHEHQQQQETAANAAASESRQSSGTSESNDAADSTLHNVSEMLDVSVRSQPQVPTALPAGAPLPVTAACTTTEPAAASSLASASRSRETPAGEPLSRLQAGLSICGGSMMRSQSGSSVIGAMLLLLDTLTLGELREVRAAVDERISRASSQVADDTIAASADDTIA